MRAFLGSGDILRIIDGQEDMCGFREVGQGLFKGEDVGGFH